MRRWMLTLAGMGLLGIATAADKTESPKPIAPQFAGVGRLAPSVAATDLAGKPFDLAALGQGKKGVVVAITSTSCPVSKKYLPTLAALEKEFGATVGFVYVNPIATDAAEAMTQAAATVSGPYLHDKTGRLAKAFGAATTGDVFLIDAGRTIVYRGAIDDQYGVGYSTDSPKNTYLADAIRAVVAGKPVSFPATLAPGCALDLESAPASAAVAVTYHNRISRILATHCVDCHRTGGVGPFPLTSLDDVVAHKGMIKKVVEKGTMPPWFSHDKAGPSPWVNDRSLTEADKKALADWLAASTPAGDTSDAPLPRTYPKDWSIGTPDLVVKLPKPVAIKATGTMPYQVINVETNLTEDRWIQAYEIHPTVRAVVHHVLVFNMGGSASTAAGGLARLREQAEERQGFFAAYVPGNDGQVFPEGFAKKLPKGAKLRFQIHYTPNGTATEDQMELGFVFAKAPPKHELKVAGIANPKINIPPGEANHPEVAVLRVPFDAVITAFMPHMHVRGKACSYEITTADGMKPLLDIPHYDFNWQLKYQLVEPLVVSKGTVMKFHATFDNSDKNPANPDPTKTVKWGQQTYDEMMLGYIEYYLPTAGK